MAICYSYVLSSLLLLLLITHWTNTTSLRSFLRSSSKWSLDRRHPSFFDSNELTTSEPILSRRRPLLPPSERRKRWGKDEILIDETIIEQVTSTTTNDNETTVLIDTSNDIFLFNSTIIKEQLTITNSQINSTVTEISYPLLRQDMAEINQTDELSTVSINEGISQNNGTGIDNIFPTTISDEVLDINTTESGILLTDITDINQVIPNETNESVTDAIDNLTTSEIIINGTSISINQTIEETSDMSQTEFSTNLISTMNATTDDNQTSIDSETEYTPTITDEEINNTTMTMSEDEYSNETISLVTKTIEKPVCDLSCQCSRKCPYGFEILNDICECDPPCKNYQCFGNDTCTVTNKGQPVCRPENGTEHDRPNQCYQPRDAGYHDESLGYYDRWYYNPDQDACHLFVYRGLGGNENNFQTLQECHVECIICATAPDPGTCLCLLHMWYYDYRQNQCLQFDYSGCKGNENKFLRKQDCVDTCITRILNL